MHWQEPCLRDFYDRFYFREDWKGEGKRIKEGKGEDYVEKDENVLKINSDLSIAVLKNRIC